MVTRKERFRPPPGWPVPPEDWVPPPDWVPDKSWPPAPPEWKFWVPVEPPPAPPLIPAPPPDIVPRVSRPGRRLRRPLTVGATLAGTYLLFVAAIGVALSGQPPPDEVHEVFAAPYRTIGAMAVDRLDGAPVVIVHAGYFSDLQVIDLATGERLRTLGWDELNVNSIATGGLSGTPVAVVSGGLSSLIQVFDLTTGEPLRELTSNYPNFESVAVGELAGAPVAVATSATGRDRDIQVWDLATGDLLVEPFGSLEGGWEGGRALALTELDGRAMVVAGGQGGLSVWDIADPQQPTWERRLSDRHGGDLDIPETAAVAELDGTPVAISGSRSGPAIAADQVTVWDLTTGHRLARLHLPGRHGGPTAIATSELAGTPVAVVSYVDGSTVVWDLRSQQPIRTPATGHTDRVEHLAITQLDGETVVVSGSQDGRVLRWPLSPPRATDTDTDTDTDTE
jgi:WD40 repeat protein